MKKNIYILIIVIIVGLIITVLINSNKATKINSLDEKKLKEKTENIAEEITDNDFTYDKFTSIVGKNVPNVNIAVGPNSYLRNKPEDKLIKKYKLEKYTEIQEKLVQNVEKKYLDSLNYEVTSTKGNNHEYCQNVKITSYYYSLYLYDFINITNGLLNKDLEDIATSEKTQIEYYKSHVTALKVLDSHLDDYENTTNESIEKEICFVNGQISSKDEALGFILALQGENYPNMNFSAEINVKRAQERLDKYLKEAANVKI